MAKSDFYAKSRKCSTDRIILQQPDYRYNIRGWLTRINDSASEGCLEQTHEDWKDFVGFVEF